MNATDTKWPMVTYWEGVPVAELSHAQLCEIVTELVSEKEADRAREHERRTKALNYLNSFRVIR